MDAERTGRVRHGRGGSTVDGPSEWAEVGEGLWEETRPGPKGRSLAINFLGGGADGRFKRRSYVAMIATGGVWGRE